MELRILNTEEITEIYNTHMVKDFPRAELKPLEHIINTTNKGLCVSVGMYETDKTDTADVEIKEDIENKAGTDNKTDTEKKASIKKKTSIVNKADNAYTGKGRDGLLVGYAVFILPDGYKYGLLDYLAITCTNRGKGYGHAFFSEVKKLLALQFPLLKGFFIECEAVERAENEKEAEVRRKRISFYEDCGCKKTRLGSRLFGVEYSVLMKSICDDGGENNYSCTQVSRDDLDFIYKKMFKPHHYKEQVSLWERLDGEILSMSAKKLAPYLIGKLLCRNIDGNIIKYRITETECYCGEEDTACHAHKGKTERTKVLYEKGGTSYVYLCYGIHSLFNVVSGVEGHPEAVLIRGVEGYDGPGKLTKAMKIDRELNGVDMTVSEELWLEDDGAKCKYRRDKRVGIDYATPKYRDILWRYILVEK